MNRPRRVRSPSFGYDPRMMARSEQRPPQDYDEPYPPPGPHPYELQQNGPQAFIDPQAHQQQYPIGYRDHRLPSAYRAPLRESYTGSAPYKILCITNINHKVSDSPVKEALLSDFSRFGDISVSICHDSGERLAYIYFRTYEEAREARHAKSRTILFDRPIEIEPIYDPRGSPIESSPPPPPTQSQPLPPQYSRSRRSVTPPDYYNGATVLAQQSRRAPLPPPPPPPPSHYPPHAPLARPYPSPGPSPPMHAGHMPYDRYFMQPPHLPSPYSSPPHDQYRSYHPPPPPPHQFPPGSQYIPSSYGPPGMPRERDPYLMRSPRHEAHYPVDHRSGPYPPQQPPPSQPLPNQHSSRRHHQHPSLSPVHHPSTTPRRSPPTYPHLDLQSPRYMSREFRREKYGPDGYNIEPEEGRPSRVLFVTNIDPGKTENELRNIFNPFGLIEEIELRKVGPDVSSVLIKFSSMDCAYKAKTAMNGKYLGDIKCRIAYGKVSASRRLWIGGLGSQTTVATLQEEFGRFGEIISFDYISGRPYAYVEYESANQAQFATHHLKGSMVADAERKLRIEYVDPTIDRNDSSSGSRTSKVEPDNPNTSSKARLFNEAWQRDDRETSPANISRKRSISPNELCHKRAPHLFQNDNKYIATPTSLCEEDRDIQTHTNIHEQEEERNELNNNKTVNREERLINQNEMLGSKSNIGTEESNLTNLVDSRSIRDVINCCSLSWFCQLVLRNFTFPSKMFMCSGQKLIIEKYITKLNGESGDHYPVLRITQRWRLHPQPKLEEVKRRMQEGNLGILIITSSPERSPSLSSPSVKTPQTPNVSATSIGSEQNGDKDMNLEEKSEGTPGGSASQSRPLKNLISYLEQKDAAGVISLTSLDNDHATFSPKLLYAFPPGDFAFNLLKRKAPNLSLETSKEEFLLGVIVGGTDTKI